MKSKNMCSGCHNNDYNNGLGGSKECWSYKGAKIINRIILPCMVIGFIYEFMSSGFAAWIKK